MLVSQLILPFSALVHRKILAIVSAVLIPLSGFASASNDFTPGASARADFNGDGTPDLLLRHDDGRWQLYSLDGSTVLSNDPVSANMDTAWVPISFADFNDDGNADILLRHDDGSLWLYTMNGADILSSSAVMDTLDLPWEPVSIQDTDNDGKADILLRNSRSGGWWRYGMDGADIISSRTVRASWRLAWVPVSYADFNGDGSGDILLRNSDSDAWWLYTINGGVTMTSRAVSANQDSQWQPVSHADFNGDGKADILLRNIDDGRWWLYTLDGSTIEMGSSVPASNNMDWQAVSFADHDGDGKADILIRNNTTGGWWLYLMDGSSITAQGRMVGLTGASEWQPVATQDYNRDGSADILIRNTATGRWWLYTLNGHTVTSSSGIRAANDRDWLVIPYDRFAPGDESAFNMLVVGKRFSREDPSNYTDFLVDSRFREIRGSVTYQGNYTWESTGSNTGNLTLTYDDGDTCTSILRFVTATSGTSTDTCSEGESVTSAWHMEEANNAPMMVGTIRDQTLVVAGKTVDVNVSRAFTDPDGDDLTYTAESDSTDIATVSVSGATVTITPVAEGSATVTVTASDVKGLTATQTFMATVGPESGGEGPDLNLGTPKVSGSNLETGASFTLSVTVHNTGTAESPATTLRYYRSTNSKISRSDNQVGSDAVHALDASGTSPESISLSAPGTAGVYYYGACVDSVAGESDNAANCSVAVRILVEDRTGSTSPDLELGVPTVTDSSPVEGASFTLSATVRNAGDAESSATTLRYYRSSNPAITRSDTVVGTDAVVALAASGTSPESISLSAPNTAGVYYYGACVDPVTNESDTSDNCSVSVRVEVVNRARTTFPDLELRAPTVTDSNPETGASFTLSTVVSNAGDARSVATTLRYYRSPDATITRSDTAVGTDAVGALGAAGTSSESISLTAPDTAGIYYYGACVDSVTDESDTTNNCSVSVRVEVVARTRTTFPDLELGVPSVTDSNPETGASLTLSTTVRNTGGADSPATTLRYYRSSDVRISSSDTQIGIDAVDALPTSRTSTESILLTVPATAGTVYYGACVDAVADESDTTDNCSVSVQVDVEEPKYPDLEVSRPIASDSSTESGALFTLSVMVNNVGDAESQATTLRYYRSTNTTITSSDTAVGNDAVGALAASTTSAESISLTAPAMAGAYYYGACVDSVAGESDTTDNCSVSVRVDVEEPKYPDLEVSTPTVSDSSLEMGASFTLSATVSNAGDAESLATTLRYYRSTDATITRSDTVVGNDAVVALGASGSSTESISLTAPATAGVHYYGACVDSVTGESDTTDNCSISVRVDVEPPPQPDLEVGTPTASNTDLDGNEKFTLSATVSNVGDGDSAATTLSYYRSTNTTIDTSDTAVGSDSVGALSPSGTSDESIVLTAPSTEGDYYYGACVNAVTNESDTTDNCSTSVQVSVKDPTPRPDLKVKSPTVSKSNPRPDASFTLSATVSNDGGGSSVVTTLRYYQSTDATITTSDTAIGTDAVDALSPAGTSAETITLTAQSTDGTYYYGACVDGVADESDTTNNCSVAVVVEVKTPVTSSGFDIDIAYVGPQPPANIREGINRAVAVWERAITNDLGDIDFDGDPRNNLCTNGDFDGYVDDVRVYIYYNDIDGRGGTVASAGACTVRLNGSTPVLGRISFDSSDVGSSTAAGLEGIALHELAHVLGFGIRWRNLQNPSLENGDAVVPAPDTHWAGTNAVAAFNAAGGSSYTGGKVPVENERGGSGSQDSHWRLSVMPGEVMTYNLSGTTFSAITLQSMADLGYTIDISVADSYTVPSTTSSQSAVAAARTSPVFCEVFKPEVDFVQ